MLSLLSIDLRQQHSFPTRRSSDLGIHRPTETTRAPRARAAPPRAERIARLRPCGASAGVELYAQDRKSTRLNSSHGSSSYAVFCLKKKKILSQYTSY